MNTELRKMIVEAEGRFLSETEVARMREYAITMRTRLDAVRRLEGLDSSIVLGAVERFVAKQPEYVKKTPGAAEKARRDLTVTLRYLAAAHVREDQEFFRVRYAEWTAEFLRATVDPAVLVDEHTALRDSLAEYLDPLDARALCVYLDVFIAELSR